MADADGDGDGGRRRRPLASEVREVYEREDVVLRDLIGGREDINGAIQRLDPQSGWRRALVSIRHEMIGYLVQRDARRRPPDP